MPLRPRELGRRFVVAGALALLPFVASRAGMLRWYAYAAAQKVYMLALWGGAVTEVVGASASFVFSVGCCAAAVIALALSATRIIARRPEALERPYMSVRALVLLHGAVGPFLALSATQQLSPTVRGRPVLARYLAVVLEHQAFLAFATAAVAGAWLVGSLRPRLPRELLDRVRIAGALIPACVVCGVASRVLARTFARAEEGLPVAIELEFELVLAITAIVLTILTPALLAARRAPTVPGAAGDESAPAPAPLAAVPRTIATMLLPLFATTVVCWASSRPCDPDPEALGNAPTVPSAATLPLPLARGEAEASAEEGVLVADAAKRVRDVWPRGGRVREVRLVVQRDVFERGRTGIFARWGDGRFGVLRMTLADRDAPQQTCATVGSKRCVEVSAGTVAAATASLKASDGPGSFVVPRSGRDRRRAGARRGGAPQG